LREYINRELVECDHANPDQKTVDMACRPKPRTNAEKKKMMKPNRLYRAKLSYQQFARQSCAARQRTQRGIRSEPSPEKQASDQPRVENLGGGVFSVDALINTPPQMKSKNRKYHQR
jgi:exodeoxyribonuclease VIII